jgi:TolB-like protein
MRLRHAFLIGILLQGSVFAQNTDKYQTVKSRLKRMTYDLVSSYIRNKPSGKPVFAVMNFNNIGSDAEALHIGESVSEYVSYLFSRASALTVVERKQIKVLLDEMALQQSGLTGEQTAIDFGKLAGAQYIVTGSVAPIGGDYHIVARILEVESGRVASTALTEIEANHLISFSSEFYTPAKNQLLAGFLSILPGMGQFFNGQTGKGLLFLTGYVVSIGTALLCHNLSEAAYDDYQAHTLASVAKYDDAQKYASISRTGFWVGMGLTVFSIWDATMEAGKLDRKIMQARQATELTLSDPALGPDNDGRVSLAFRRKRTFLRELTGEKGGAL